MDNEWKKIMLNFRLLMTASLVFLITVACLANSAAANPAPDQPAAAPASSTTKAASVPDELIRQMEAKFAPPEEPMSKQRAVSLLRQRLKEVIELGAEAEKKYPDAPNIHRVRRLMLQAGNFLAFSDKEDGISPDRLMGIADRIVQSDAPLEDKAEADYVIALLKLKSLKTGPSSPQAAMLIRQFNGRYENTQAAAVAAYYATVLAMRSDQKDLVEALADQLAIKHAANPNIRGLLRHLGRHPDVGKPFVAKLSRLGGGELKLPDDLLGKVVVVDFWATWCSPCVQSVPHFKQLYAKYRDKGVEFVGISLDQDRSRLGRFIRDEKIEWIQTYSGLGWNDPTAAFYGIRAIPSVWVIGRDGRVVSDGARGQLERILDGAIQALPG